MISSLHLLQNQLFWCWPRECKTNGAAQGEFYWLYPESPKGIENFYKYRGIQLKFGVVYSGFDPAYDEGGWPGPGWKLPVTVENFQHTLDMGLQYVDPLQIVTWNDYEEGTNIEPTTELGYSFLTILQKTMGVKYTQADLEKVTELYHRKVYFANNQTMLNILEKKHFNLVNK